MSVKITDTTLRDAHQSLIATRMRTRDMLDVASKLDKVGFYSLEMWGGATFDAQIRFLNEDPWERLREIRKRCPNTRMQMLLRGQNLVGYRHYADDVVDEFVRLSVKNGMDIFRIFDALNDIRNMRSSIEAVKKYKSHAQGTICYTTSPVHTNEKFADLALELANMGCDSICIKDMAGLISPKDAYELVALIKKKVNIPVDLHTHCTSGMGPVSCYAAVQAGCDIIDTAFSAFSWGTSQPSTEGMVASFKGTEYDTGLDLKLLDEISKDFNKIRETYEPLFTPTVTVPDVAVLLHQIPGGMISNLVSQLKTQGALDKLQTVLEEVPRVRAELGYPPLVTPSSQVVGTQAVLNVLYGERYKQVTKETKNYVLGLYGAIPNKMDPAVVKLIIGDEKPIDCRPADLLKPELGKAKEVLTKENLIKQEEDIMTYAMYPEVALKFLKGEIKEEVIQPKEAPVAKASAPVSYGGPAAFTVDVDGDTFTVKVSPLGEMTAEPAAAKVTYDDAKTIKTPMNGMVLSVAVKEGDKIEEGTLVATIEAMKMASEILSDRAGTVTHVLIKAGDMVDSKQAIVVVE